MAREVGVRRPGEPGAEGFVVRACGEIPVEQPLESQVDLLGRHAAQERPADRGLRAQAAAQKDVIPLPALGQPSRWIERSETASPKTCSRCAVIVPRRLFVSATAKLQ